MANRIFGYTLLHRLSIIKYPPHQELHFEGDKIIVDNEACTIMNVYSSATRSF